jgi:hypothetical protein
MAKDHEKTLAKELYLNIPTLTQKDIAQRVGVRESTVGRWVEAGGWEEQRRSYLSGAHQIQSLAQKMGEKFLAQLIAKLDDPDGEISVGDIDALNKLGAALERIAGRESLRGYITHINLFVQWLSERQPNLAESLLPHVDEFYREKAVQLSR